MDEFLPFYVLLKFAGLLATVIGLWAAIRWMLRKIKSKDLEKTADNWEDQVKNNTPDELLIVAQPLVDFRRALGAMGLFILVPIGIWYLTDQYTPFGSFVPYALGLLGLAIFVFAVVRSRRRHLAYEAMLRSQKSAEE